ncbi:hypothetical protein Peur_012275 [Populus x canadensis]
MKMRQMWAWMLLMALAFVNDRSHCCLEEERISLLEIKAWFNHAGAAGSYDQLEGLRNLEILILAYNDFKESILIESLGALPSLKTLYAWESNFKHVGKGLCNSSSLEEVFLDDSFFPASFLRNIGPLSTLKVLHLARVDFHSTLPAQGNSLDICVISRVYS